MLLFPIQIEGVNLNISKISQGNGGEQPKVTIRDPTFFNMFKNTLPRLQWTKTSDEMSEDMGVVIYAGYIMGRKDRWVYRISMKTMKTDVIEIKIEASIMGGSREIAVITINRDQLLDFMKRNFRIDAKLPVIYDELLPPGAIRGIDKKFAQTQDFSKYYQGEVPDPDYLSQFVGTSAVDTSKLSGMVNVNKAVQFVNEFDGSLLKNISVIFNSADSGSYGVYVPSLDRAIKTKALQNMLEQKGYTIAEENGVLVAYPKEGDEKTIEEIDGDIKNLYSQLESHGGTVFGVNMNKVIEAAKSDPANKESPYPDLWQLLAILHLGATIVHEAVHAKGATGEGPSETVEQRFIQWVLPKINQQYLDVMKGMNQEDKFSPIEIGNQMRHANGNNWYKFSQAYYLPQGFLGQKATGSDLDGRHGRGVPGQQGMADWGKINNMGKYGPIEGQLGRQHMSPLPRGLSQENDIMELQLRKYTVEDAKLDPQLITEQLLAKDRVDNLSPYMTIEQMMEEDRPSPLITTINKEASNEMIKTATLFGWMNNLSISDGSTIPGLGDRVMLWEDRDECFSEEEDWIKEQSRYNPVYDIKGFFYRYIEPRFEPQLFDDMTRDLTNTHPAKRFASDKNGLYFIMSALNTAFKHLNSKKIKATRFLITEDVCEIVNKFAENKKLGFYTYILGELNGQDVYACWLANSQCNEKKIESLEGKIRLNKIDDKDITDVFGSPYNSTAIDEIIKCSEKICREYSIEDLYLVGAYAREKFTGVDSPTVNELNFNSNSARRNFQIAQLMVEKLGVKKARLYTNTMTFSFVYKGIKVDFYGGYIDENIEKMMKNKGLECTDMLISDVCNRDFTINMYVYNIKSKIVSCPIDIKIKIGYLETYFDPSVIVQLNPAVALRAIDMCVSGNISMDKKLEIAIMEIAPKLRDEKYRDMINMIYRKDPDKVGKLLVEYGIKENENANTNQT